MWLDFWMNAKWIFKKLEASKILVWFEVEIIHGICTSKACELKMPIFLSWLLKRWYDAIAHAFFLMPFFSLSLMKWNDIKETAWTELNSLTTNKSKQTPYFRNKALMRSTQRVLPSSTLMLVSIQAVCSFLKSDYMTHSFACRKSFQQQYYWITQTDPLLHHVLLSFCHLLLAVDVLN